METNAIGPNASGGYVGDFPFRYPGYEPHTPWYPNQIYPNTIQYPMKPKTFAEIFAPQPSREQIEKELLTKIADELKNLWENSDLGFSDTFYDWYEEFIDVYATDE